MIRSWRWPTAAHPTVADGMSVVWALRASGQPGPEARLLMAAGAHRLRVYFLGAKREVVTALAEGSFVIPRHQDRWLPRRLLRPRTITWASSRIQGSQAHILFVGMPPPLKESWCERPRQRFDAPV